MRRKRTDDLGGMVPRFMARAVGLRAKRLRRKLGPFWQRPDRYGSSTEHRRTTVLAFYPSRDTLLLLPERARAMRLALEAHLDEVEQSRTKAFFDGLELLQTFEAIS